MKHYIFGRPQNGHIQFLRYLIVGGTSTVVDLAVFAVCTTYFGIHYLFAAFIAYMFGLAWNYSFSLLWVFESKHSRTKEMLMVFLVALGGLFWTELFLWIGVDIFGYIPFPTKCVVVVIVLFWNYGMRKLYVFH